MLFIRLFGVDKAVFNDLCDFGKSIVGENSWENLLGNGGGDLRLFGWGIVIGIVDYGDRAIRR